MKIVGISFCFMFMGSIFLNVYNIANISTRDTRLPNPKIIVRNAGNCDDCDSEIADLEAECDADYSDDNDKIWCMIALVKIDCYDCLCDYLREEFEFDCTSFENRNAI